MSDDVKNDNKRSRSAVISRQKYRYTVTLTFDKGYEPIIKVNASRRSMEINQYIRACIAYY